MAGIFGYLQVNLAVKFDVPKKLEFASKYRKNSTRDKFAGKLRGYALNLYGQGLLVATLLLCQTNLRAAARRFLARFSALLKLFLRLILLSIGVKNQNKCKIRAKSRRRSSKG